MLLDQIGLTRTVTPSIPFLSLDESRPSPFSPQFSKQTIFHRKLITAQDLLFPTALTNQDEPASLSSLPPEILFQILSLAHSASDSKLFILSGQFTSTSPLCPLCSFRTLASVCSIWYAMMKELFWNTILLGGTADSMKLGSETVNESEFWYQLEVENNGSLVRSIDASLRIWSRGGFRTTVGQEKAEEREASIEHDRKVLARVLRATTLLHTFDADFEYFGITTFPSLLPTTIKTLTLRNIRPLDAIELTNQLPLLTNLTVRAALDFFIPIDTAPHLLASCQLTHFELSITGYGETDTHTIVERLLSGSKSTLRSLTLRNKNAVGVSLFIPVVRELVRVFGNCLEELRVFDIPNDGLRKKNEKALDWFDLKAFPLPHVRILHLCGISYSPELLRYFQLQSLRTLTIEDFDSENGLGLLQSLEARDILPQLQLFKICTRILGWNDSDIKEIEDVCRDLRIELKASWRMRRMEKDWW